MQKTSISADYVRHYNLARLRRQARRIRTRQAILEVLACVFVFSAIGFLLAL